MLNELKILTREAEAPHNFFSDLELSFYLEKNNFDIYETAYELLIIKSENSEIVLPDGTKSADNSKYWLRLARKFKKNGSRVIK